MNVASGTAPGEEAATLSTHVLDTAAGRPAVGVRLTLRSGDVLVAEGVTDADGRWRAPGPLAAGRYSLTFAVADYFRAAGVALADPPFLDEVPLHFGLAARGHHHVPLLVAPYAYSTYRGS